MSGADDNGRPTAPEGTASQFRFREEDDIRAAFPGGFNQGYGEGNDDSSAAGSGGRGTLGYGEMYGEGAQGGGAGGPAYFGDHGSNPDGTPRRFGSEGEENFDRAVRMEEGQGVTGQGTAQFSNETAGYGSEDP